MEESKDTDRHGLEGHVLRIADLENELHRLEGQRALVQDECESWKDSCSQQPTEQGISTFPEWWLKLIKVDVEIGRVHCRLDEHYRSSDSKTTCRVSKKTTLSGIQMAEILFYMKNKTYVKESVPDDLFKKEEIHKACGGMFP